MTASAARARDTPGRAAPQPFDGVLFVDLENVRARYECYRPACPQRREGPVHGSVAVPAFVADVKTQHMAKHHGGTS